MINNVELENVINYALNNYIFGFYAIVLNTGIMFIGGVVACYTI